ncbi:glyoxalase/bleomycin resistance/dioxygenase family protein [Pseudomonas tolaasii]|uniref:Glyoxalase/bleomycin resistance/dioxygenase family protein n=2 Tax=Pseudomonas tolaasii TaxID=29442 RepID=A0A7Y8AHX1_PSETO|nr:VOC family protein [Pseudomonas tolaasii]ARB30200.1 glyoxalase/bleomycin resistance/dioxygenase family protein [Pseudomonas tolaasii]KAB0466399.1 glyoxalase/bleomycin resistance/dioxygenase family protein [Pseudomonas tolaasii]MBW1247787.1 glyoxalase/bleomycin resistance/dioxygenase family protein [Pseudomonas tolaasii]MBW4793065.1 glyoxalase/bleomycin resistance/dioxygenase family protein [Pseudomonas tolaasii]MBY8941947.1 glyoxalase/bleomycin resistance/dioxygenase family protein [Pseudom
MKFASVRLVTQQFEQLVQFYKNLSGIEPRQLAPGFAELHFEGVVLAISDEALIRLYNNGLAVAASNRSAILEFQVPEVEAVLRRFSSAEVVMPVTKMPWGNTSALLSDPDGNLVNLFSKPE